MSHKDFVMPVVFVGHGSPMNIVADNNFTQSLKNLGKQLPVPKSIVVISAHWQTFGSLVVAESKPRTIYDFYGFPEELYKVNYPAPGAIELSEELTSQSNESISPDHDWGLDHGAWAVLHHIYPKADIPVTQLSLNKNYDLQQHFEVAQQLLKLRSEGVLILASGNLVHNLREIQWDENAKPYDWALEFDEIIKQNLIDKNMDNIIRPDKSNSKLFAKAHPTIEHYLPIIYAVGALTEKDQVQFAYEGIQNASISMRTCIYS